MEQRTSRLRVVFLATSVLLTGTTAITACSGKTAPSSDASATDAGSSGTVTVGCPTTPPWTRTTANGAKNPCTKEGQVCEYGSDFEPSCNTIVQCSSGEWGIPLFGAGGGKACGSPAPKPTENPADCPATRASLTEGAACNGSSTCAYDGAVCTCGTFCPQYPVSRPTCDADAGITENCCDRSKPPTWSCFEGAPYCTSPRPRVGDPCKDGDECGLAPPGECGQRKLQCKAGTWQLYEPQCPISTARAKTDIAYVGPGEAARVRDELLRVRLATYRYKAGDPSPHLGFVIEDMPAGSPAVLASRDRVDLYGYVSMAVATIQEQQKQIDRLDAELARMKRECR